MGAAGKAEVGTFRIRVSGLVQGVGFRPFIYRLALQEQISGWVENRNDGVTVLMNGTREDAALFRKLILREAPEAACIESASVEQVRHAQLNGFLIRKSEDLSDEVTEISPDIAVCKKCLNDMETQAHRILYPFINCTHCGPRFTIVRDLPYDRARTTMDAFPMCPRCRSEFEEVNDRRFHAQPVACNHCGPAYAAEMDGKVENELEGILSAVAAGLNEGRVMAVKGLGGFHLMCDAFNDTAVTDLRRIKERDGKPFALMFRSLDAARSHVKISRTEEVLLRSWRRPIVLLNRTKEISEGIADGLGTLGVMLPYMPFHYLLFRAVETDAVVLTSGNLSDEPILIDDDLARKQLGKLLGGMITNNREIFNRCDDSVAHVVNQEVRILRRSRGYAPAPVRAGFQTEGIFAAGAELVNSFAIGKGTNVYMSQYIGDLKNLETFRFYKETYGRFCRMFRFSPGVVAHDLHPDYLSTRFAKDLAEDQPGIQLVPVQHHHAHIASVMLENGLDGEVIGFSFDGLGLGADGRIWGAEAMVAGYQGFRRFFHFEYVPLPGGDRANKEPWRMAVAYLSKYAGEGFRELPLSLFKEIGMKEIDTLVHMIESGANTPQISSAGRLFDAIAGMTGVNLIATYQAEAPMKLEALADPSEKRAYDYMLQGETISFRPMILEVVEELKKGTAIRTISARFHNTLINAVLEMAGIIRKETGIKRVVLSGGTFQNRILTGRIEKGLISGGYRVIRASGIPVNDQGIAVGQLAIAAEKMKGL